MEPNNAFDFIVLLPGFAYFSQVTIVKMHQFWNWSILGRVSTFLLLKYVFLNDFLTTKSFSGWTLFLNPLQKFLKNQKLSQKGLTIVKIHQFWNCSILRRVSTFLWLKYVFLNNFLTTKSFSGWTLFLNPLQKFLKNQILSQKGLIIVKNQTSLS